jgi:O-antigen biosynthesis protein
MTTLLIIGYVWPEPNSSAAGARMMQFIELFLQQGWHITFGSPAALSEHRADLSALGVTEVVVELNSASFDHFVADLQPDIVLFDRFMMEEQFGWRVEAFCPHALRVLDTEDLHSLRDARMAVLKQRLAEQPEQDGVPHLTPAQLFGQMAQQDLAQREIASIYRCDLSIMISDFEISLLVEQFKVPPELLHLCPLMLDLSPSPHPGLESRPELSRRQHFISIGNFRHAPNWDAVLWLKHRVWPLIRARLPQAELHVFGAYPPPKATALHQPKQGFLVKGWVDDANAVMTQARVCLAPLRFGAGIKGKLTEAMLCGTPSVTTSIGAEAMSGTLAWNGLIANTADELAAAAVRLHEDEALWRQAQAQGHLILASRYDRVVLGRELIARLQSTRQVLDAHRARNFTGAMLRHHQHKSTQYMAKWIEAKNRLK